MVFVDHDKRVPEHLLLPSDPVVPKDGGPPDLLTTWGTPRIAVVTCDVWPEGRGYQTNRVVLAEYRASEEDAHDARARA